MRVGVEQVADSRCGQEVVRRLPLAGQIPVGLRVEVDLVGAQVLGLAKVAQADGNSQVARGLQGRLVVAAPLRLRVLAAVGAPMAGAAQRRLADQFDQVGRPQVRGHALHGDGTEPRAEGVVEDDVEALDGLLAQVRRLGRDVAARQPQGTVDRVAVDQVAEGRDAGVQALLESGGGGNGADPLLHVDLEVVEGHGQAFEERGRGDQTGRERRRLLRLNVRAAALEDVVLIRRRLEVRAVQRVRQSGIGAGCPAGAHR